MEEKNKQYLIINHVLGNTYFLSEITKDDLINLKNGNMDMIIDLKNETYFDPDTNSWVEIKLYEK